MIRFIFITIVFAWIGVVNATEYERNKAVPIQKVLFGTVLSVRKITEQELVVDRNNRESLSGDLNQTW